MTKKPAAESKLSPQFIDSNLLNLDDIEYPTIGSSIGFTGVFNRFPYEPPQMEMDGIEIAFDSTSEYVFGIKSNDKIDTFLVNFTNIDIEHLHRLTRSNYQELLKILKSNDVLKYFICEVFDYIFAHKLDYRETSRPHGFDQKSLTENHLNISIS